MSATTYQCEICGKDLPYGGRGRPPKLCAEHKASKPPKSPKTEPKQEEAVTGLDVPRPRPKPGMTAPIPKSDPKAAEAPKEPTTPPLPPLGKPDTQSRAKAQSATNRTEKENAEVESVPLGINGKPMVKIVFSASELIPTGQYANVSVGPAQIHAYVDLARKTNGDGYFTDDERTALTGALNEVAEIVERDVIAVQRNLVLQSIQDQLDK